MLFYGTIKENITYGLEKYSEEDLNRVVEMANLNEFLSELPNGIDTDIGEHGDKLSGGQKQRISIARGQIVFAINVLPDPVGPSINTLLFSISTPFTNSFAIS